VDAWADDRPPLQAQRKTGQWFGFFGAQAQTGGSTKSSGFNARIGSTLWQGRYDLAATLSTQTTKDASTSSVGLVGRMLFRLNPDIGWNVGAQAQRSASSSGDTLDTISVVGGLNIYVPNGSFDVTLTLGNRGTYGLLFGYTIFLTR